MKRTQQAVLILALSIALTAVIMYAGWWLNQYLTASPQPTPTASASPGTPAASPIEASRDDSQRRIHITSYREALQRYGTDIGVYPAAASLVRMGADTPPFTTLAGTYIPEFLDDPRKATGAAYYYVATEARFAVCADLASKPGMRFVGAPDGTREEQGSARECTL